MLHCCIVAFVCGDGCIYGCIVALLRGCMYSCTVAPLCVRRQIRRDRKAGVRHRARGGEAAGATAPEPVKYAPCNIGCNMQHRTVQSVTRHLGFSVAFNARSTTRVPECAEATGLGVLGVLTAPLCLQACDGAAQPGHPRRRLRLHRRQEVLRLRSRLVGSLRHRAAPTLAAAAPGRRRG